MNSMLQQTLRYFQGLCKAEDEMMLKFNKENTRRCGIFVQSRQ